MEHEAAGADGGWQVVLFLSLPYILHVIAHHELAWTSSQYHGLRAVRFMTWQLTSLRASFQRELDRAAKTFYDGDLEISKTLLFPHSISQANL